ncbi:hypothetical protein HZS_6686 [Henneguya salminicola]|nr:hypothetical protein HZS_6686 [Henneguya salminicola]
MNFIEKSSKPKKCQISTVNSVLLINFNDDNRCEINLKTSYLVLDRLQHDSTCLEVIIYSATSYFLRPLTISEREEWYMGFKMLKYSEYGCLNLYPLHKWIRVQKKSIGLSCRCVECNKNIHTDNEPFVFCDSIYKT